MFSHAAANLIQIGKQTHLLAAQEAVSAQTGELVLAVLPHLLVSYLGKYMELIPFGRAGLRILPT